MEEGKQSLPNEISAVLIRWYETHRRELPWRETTDPYRIWISEIILQQTRVARDWSITCISWNVFPTFGRWPGRTRTK